MKEELYRINQKGKMQDLIRFQLCGTTFPDKKYKIYRPSSPVWCIEYIEAGSGTVKLNDEIYFPQAGDSYFLHANKDHYYFSNPEDPWKKHFINVSGKLVDNLIEGYGLSNTAHFVGLDLSNEIKQIIEIAKKGEWITLLN